MNVMWNVFRCYHVVFINVYLCMYFSFTRAVSGGVVHWFLRSVCLVCIETASVCFTDRFWLVRCVDLRPLICMCVGFCVGVVHLLLGSLDSLIDLPHRGFSPRSWILSSLMDPLDR